MRDEVRRDMETSARLLREVVWPHCRQQWWPDAELVQNENRPEEWATQLDMLGGIDWFVKRRGQLYALATRVQWTGVFETFTVRYRRPNQYHPSETELRKRGRSIAAPGSLCPAWWCHAYVKDELLVHAGFAKVEDVIAAAIEFGKVRHNGSDSVEFKCVSWRDMKANGFAVRVLKPM